ncbi:MAG: pantoate--beta-alanine ligase [Actinomycetota bacterium]
MKIVPTFAETRALKSGRVGLVPTMGFLHEGHLSLIEAARSDSDTVIVSVFVNPLQFGAGEDLDAYPRELDRDASLAEAAGADVLFAPPLSEMYPDEPLTRVSVASVTDGMEGERRPGHFNGVATVVAKLFAGIAPDRAYFGRKDAQQLVTVRRMTTDLSFPIRIVGAPIVREADGLALSSRNTYLTDDERVAARTISTGILAAADAVKAGERSGRVLEQIAAQSVEGQPGIDLEYATLADQDTAEQIAGIDRPAFLAMTARVGRTRLLDNVHIDRTENGWTPDRGIRLERSSILYKET